MNEFHHKFERLDLNLLKVFEVIHREGSLSRAADVLALTPSAVSHALRRLREHFGDPLFERVGHKMVPTPLCHQIAEDIALEMTRLRAMMQRWDRFDPLESRGKMALAMPDALEMFLLPDLSEAFAQAAPGMQVISAAVYRRTLAADLQRGQLDLAIDVGLPAQVGLMRTPLMRSDWCMMARADHPVILNPTLASFERARHVVVSSRAFGAVLEDQSLTDRGVRRDVHLRTQSYLSAIAALSRSELVLTMPRILAEYMRPLERNLRLAPLPFPMTDLNLFMYWHENHEGDKRATWLRQVVHNVADEISRTVVGPAL